ncbi:hypothetical protein [Bacteroides mediterraneensis]|uniref:DUF4493 domain-containing protein n=1 Tax=Bacteroides mediterraneensis TaxID=1841856 RepID=A0ABS2EWC9_9BACE|nr:hypothetical protein [Bacteroides mediterraneensis]MBM6758972.1 hypothetical protein [Bacteroides mediterraneensis]
MMKCKVNRIYPLWGLLLSFPLWNVSCVDNKYDLDKDIDMTINVGGEHLAVPVGSTDTAFLSKIIEVEEGDILQPDAATHIYHLTKQDDINVNPTTVNKVMITDAKTDLEQKIVENASGSTSSVSTTIEISNTLTAEASDIDEALKELGSLSTNTPAILDLTFGLKGNGLTYSKVDAKDLVIQLPTFLIFKEGEVEAGNKLTLNGALTPKQLDVIGYTFGEKAGDGLKPDENRSLTIKGDVSMKGDVVTSGISGSGDLSLTLYVTLSEMATDRVTGVIQPKIEAEKTQIEFNDLPDFLQDEATRLDVTNPVIVLIATNPLETPVEVDAVLTPKKNNATIEGHEVKIGAGYGKTAVTLNPGENVIALSRIETSLVAGMTSNVVVSDMNNVLEIIPDDIDVDLKPVVRNNDYYAVELGQDYQLTASYDVDVPLSFEKGLNIVYSDSIKDLNKDLKDLDKITLKKANIVLTVDNAIPLGLQLKAENVQIKDIYGRELTGIEKTIEEGKEYITESGDGETPATSEIVLSLTTANDPGFLSKIDKICFKITAATGATTGIPLKDTQWVKVTSVKLSVPGGVNVDLN